MLEFGLAGNASHPPCQHTKTQHTPKRNTHQNATHTHTKVVFAEASRRTGRTVDRVVSIMDAGGLTLGALTGFAQRVRAAVCDALRSLRLVCGVCAARLMMLGRRPKQPLRPPGPPSPKRTTATPTQHRHHNTINAVNKRNINNRNIQPLKRKKQLFRALSAMDSDNYPETACKIFVVRNAAAFTAIWKVRAWDMRGRGRGVCGGGGASCL